MYGPQRGFGYEEVPSRNCCPVSLNAERWRLLLKKLS